MNIYLNSVGSPLSRDGVSVGPRSTRFNGTKRRHNGRCVFITTGAVLPKNERRGGTRNGRIVGPLPQPTFSFRIENG